MVNKVLRVGQCTEAWRLWTQPTWLDPTSGYFILAITDLADEEIEVEVPWNIEAADLEDLIETISDGWLMQISGGPIHKQCLVFRGHRIKGMSIPENSLQDCQPYIWTGYYANTT